MKDQFKEIREDVMDEQKAIEESIKRMSKLRNDFDPNKEDYSIEPASSQQKKRGHGR